MFSQLSATFKRYVVQLQTPRHLSSSAVRTAYAVAVTADVMQLLLGPLGWVGFDEAADVVAAFLISRLLGFHPLLLPTFVLEFVPFTDLLPTWTGCVALVVRSRRRQGLVVDDPPGSTPIIDVKAKRVD
jgi:hypothetical protein